MNTSLSGRDVKVMVNDIVIIGKLIATKSKFPTVSLGLGHSFEVSYNTAYRAVYMGAIIKM